MPKKTKMVNFDVEALIELVRKHPFLYDIRHSKYKDAQLKAAIWESIAQKLNRNCDTVKHKWKTVRDGYIKYIKMVRDTEGSGKKVIEYIWSSQLSFLDNCDRRKVKNSWDKLATSDSAEHQTDNSLEATSQSPTPSHWSEDRLVEPPPAKRKKTELEEGDLQKILQYVNTSRLNSNDAVDHLFMSYAQTFKKFSPMRQAELKIELANLFANAELKELEADTMSLDQSFMSVKSEHHSGNDNSESE